MPKRFFGRKKLGRRPRRRVAKTSTAAKGRRRLMPTLATAAAAAATYKGYKTIQSYRQARKRAAYNKAKATYTSRLASSDNITSLPAMTIGTPREPTFTEKVDRINNPPVIYKRNYAWSAECSSGRKGWFQIPINHLDPTYIGGSLYDDSINAYNRGTTNTATIDPTVLGAGQVTDQQTYVEFLSQYLRLVNSGTNSITGTIQLVAYVRDADQNFANQPVPTTPINMMMLCSTNSLTGYVGQYEQYANPAVPVANSGVGNGFQFDTATAGVNMSANYVMPGSTVNVGGSTAQTDPHLNLFSSQIKNVMSHYFKTVSKTGFSLKPGQQVNQYLKVADSPILKRETLDYWYLRGISFFLVIEFEAGIVGSNIANNVISSGSGQLSCILEEKRIIGVSGRLRTKLVMPTAPLAGIALANQVTINPDTGVQDVGYEEDA